MAHSFFESKRNPYYILAHDFRHSSAGIRCLHYLCHALNELGHEAYLANAKVFSPYLRTPRLSRAIVLKHFSSGQQPIAVYPEVISGNPLGAPHVARWLLNTAGHLGGDTAFSPDDQIYCHYDWCLPPGTTGTQLTIPSMDTRIFNNRDNPFDTVRSGFCRYANKFLVHGGKIRPEHAHFTSLGHEVRLTPEEIAAILRRSEALYCYERSAIIEEALACGCPVLLIESDYWQIQSIEISEPGIEIDSGPDALQRARAEIGNPAERIEQRQAEAWDHVRRFIEQTQEHARTRSHVHEKSDGHRPTLASLWYLVSEERGTYRNHFRRMIAELPALRVAEPAMRDESSQANDVSDFVVPAIRRLVSGRPPHSFRLLIIDHGKKPELLHRTLDSIAQSHHRPLLVSVITPRSDIRKSSAPDLPVSYLTYLRSPCERISECFTDTSADWIGVLRSGDELIPEAITLIDEFLHDHPDCRHLGIDHDVIDNERTLRRPTFWPRNAIDLIRGTGHTYAMPFARRDLWLSAGGWRQGMNVAGELDASLRLFQAGGMEGHNHLPGVIVHQHSDNEAVHLDTAATHQLRELLVAEHLARSGIPANVTPSPTPGKIRIKPEPKVGISASIIIFTRDNLNGLSNLLASINRGSTGYSVELIIVDNGTSEPQARAYLDNLVNTGHQSISVLSYPKPFSLADAANTAVHAARGEVVVFLHDDIEILHDGWIEELTAHCLSPGVAIAGPRLISLRGTITEAGVVPMQIGIAGPSFSDHPADEAGSHQLLDIAHDVSAISSACMMVRRDVYLAVGGMDGENFPCRVADIDFCLKLRAAGHKIVWTPDATLLHDSDDTMAGNRNDNNALLAKWGSFLVDDPYVNPYIALDSTAYQPEHDPTFLPDPIPWHPLPNIYAAMLGNTAVNEYRIGNVIRSATAVHRARGRVGTFLPIPVQLKRLSIDVVQLAAPITDHQIKELAVHRQLLGCRVVMDLDPLFDESTEHLRFEIQRHDRVVDVFTTSSPMLADMFDDMAGRIVVIPDALDDTLWNGLTTRCQTGEKLRIGWHGSTNDLEAIAPVVMSLADEVDWIFIGEFPEVLEACARERHRDVAYSDYPAKLASLNLDLAVCPLAMTPNNRWRSDLPILQYGALGIPVVATDIDAYRTGLPITLTGNTIRGWTESIRAYAGDRATCRQKGEALREHVLTHRTLAGTMTQWLQVWNSTQGSLGPTIESAFRSLPPAGHLQTPSVCGETVPLQPSYQKWLSARHDAITNTPSLLPTSEISFHLVLRQPDKNTSNLADTLENLSNQSYSHWHLDVVTPLPPPAGIEDVPSIGWHDVGDGSMQALINALANNRNADWIIELPPGAVLDPLCLWRLSREIGEHPDARAFFVDDDCYDKTGTRMTPRFKPGTSVERLKSSDLAGPLFVKREAWLAAGGAPSNTESLWFGQLLCIAERFGWQAIRHVPDVLISYPERFPSNTEACLTELARHLLTANLDPHFSPASETSWRIGYTPIRPQHVSICIASQGRLDLLNRTVSSLLENTDYPSFDIVIGVPGNLRDEELAHWLDDCHRLTGGAIRHLAQGEGNSFSTQVGQLAASASGEYILLAEEGMTVQDKHWLNELAGVLDQPDVAAASPMILDPATGKICSAGRVLGLGGGVGATLPDAQHASSSDVAILPGQCLLAKKQAYDEQGGLSNDYATRDMAIADLCLRWHESGQRLVCTALSKVLCADFKLPDLVADKEQQLLNAQTLAREEARFTQHWLKNGTRDPYWNPNLSLADPEPGIETRYAAQWQFLPDELPKIAARPVPNSQGDYRINYYLDALSRAGKASACIWQQPLDDPRQPTAAEICRLGADSLVLQNYTLPHQMEILHALRKLGTQPFIVHALDDLLTNLDPNSPFTAFNPPDTRSRLKYALAHSDRLVVSTHYLAESFQHLIDDIRVVPNRLPGSLWLPLHSKRHTGERPRLGWAGGITHHTDLMLLKEVILETKNEADWIFFGMCPPELRPLLTEFHALAPREEFPQRLAALNLDLAVAPLADIPFNHAKSNLRLLEYGVLGIPVVCSDVEPYRNSPACRVENTTERWIAALRERIHDPDAREAEGRLLRRWVHEHFLIENHMDEWLTAHLP